MDRNNLVTCADFSSPQHAEIEPGAAACEETLDHIVAAKFQIQFETGKARLCDDPFRRANREAVSDTDRAFGEARRRQIFSKGSPGKINARQFLLPERIVLGRIGVY